MKLMMSCLVVLVLLLVSCVMQGQAFRPATTSTGLLHKAAVHRHLSMSVLPTTASLADAGMFDGLVNMIKYRESCDPGACIEQSLASALRASVSADVIHVLHPLFLGLSIVALALPGAYYGLVIKKTNRAKRNREEQKYSPETIRKAYQKHSSLMSVLLVIYAFGFPSGLLDMLILQQPLIESTHSLTSVISFLLLLTQAGISTQFSGQSLSLRRVHSILGMITMTSIGIHALTGIQLFFDIHTPGIDNILNAVLGTTTPLG